MRLLKAPSSRTSGAKAHETFERRLHPHHEQRQHDAVQYLWERMKESGWHRQIVGFDGWYCGVPEGNSISPRPGVTKFDEDNHTEYKHLCPTVGNAARCSSAQEESLPSFSSSGSRSDRSLQFMTKAPGLCPARRTSNRSLRRGPL